MLTPLQQSLLRGGYKQYLSDEPYLGHSTNQLFQKRIVDDLGTRYFINVYYYPEQRIEYYFCPECIQVEVQFKDADDEVINVTLSEKSIDKFEKKLQTMFEVLNLEYYERY